MKKQKAKEKKKKKSNKESSSTESKPNWVEDRLLEWLGSDSGSTSCEADHDISIISWNVLADSYCAPRSHPHLPKKFQRHVFDRPQRQLHVRKTLQRLATTVKPSLIALQEVDGPLMVGECMNELGYQGIQTPTSPAGNGGRVDACCLYFQTSVWTFVQSEVVRLDDLAIMSSSSSSSSSLPTYSRSTTNNNLQGVQTSFIRKNQALLVRLQHIQSNRHVVVAVVHLYWNPAHEYVKVRVVVFLVLGLHRIVQKLYSLLFSITIITTTTAVMSSALCTLTSPRILFRR